MPDPITYQVQFGPQGEIVAAGNNFQVDHVGGVICNGLTPTGDSIPCDGDFVWISGGVVIKSPNGTKYRVKVDNDGNIGTENA